jgi:hypothetical protein
LGGSPPRRYAQFLTRARDRHLQIADTARRLLVDMVATMSGDRTKRRTLALAKRLG